jgi:hypothetical protein
MTATSAPSKPGSHASIRIGGTALLDTVEFSEGYLREHATRDRRALMIVTDGKDNASAATLKSIQAAAERTDTTVCCVTEKKTPDPFSDNCSKGDRRRKT